MVNAIVIDDDRDTVDVFVDYLRLLNVDVWGVGYDGKAAVELFELHRPNLVFLDLMMPEYDGFYALERIRKIDAAAKVIVVTADLRNDTEEALRKLNPTEIIYKPYNPEQLKTIIERLSK